jgi:hypothetical protein
MEAYDSVRRKVLYNILAEFGIPMKLVRLTKMCLNESCSRVWVGKHLSDMFHVKNYLNQGNALWQLLFNIALENGRSVQVKQDGIKLNGTYQLLVYADYLNVLGGSVHNIKRNTEAANKETRLALMLIKLNHVSRTECSTKSQSKDS